MTRINDILTNLTRASEIQKWLCCKKLPTRSQLEFYLTEMPIPV